LHCGEGQGAGYRPTRNVGVSLGHHQLIRDDLVGVKDEVTRFIYAQKQEDRNVDHGVGAV
jgi:hypothetical protein